MHINFVDIQKNWGLDPPNVLIKSSTRNIPLRPGPASTYFGRAEKAHTHAIKTLSCISNRVVQLTYLFLNATSLVSGATKQLRINHLHDHLVCSRCLWYILKLGGNELPLTKRLKNPNGICGKLMVIPSRFVSDWIIGAIALFVNVFEDCERNRWFHESKTRTHADSTLVVLLFLLFSNTSGTRAPRGRNVLQHNITWWCVLRWGWEIRARTHGKAVWFHHWWNTLSSMELGIQVYWC